MLGIRKPNWGDFGDLWLVQPPGAKGAGLPRDDLDGDDAIDIYLVTGSSRLERFNRPRRGVLLRDMVLDPNPAAVDGETV